MASMEQLLTCLVLGVLATCTGVTHWKLKNGVITAVNSGDTVFTAAAPTDSSSPRGSCGEDKGVIHDRILAVLRQRSTYNGVRNSELAHSMTTVINSNYTFLLFPLSYSSSASIDPCCQSRVSSRISLTAGLCRVQWPVSDKSTQTLTTRTVCERSTWCWWCGIYVSSSYW